MCSVTQGSIIDPSLFTMYTADLAELASKYGVKFHAFVATARALRSQRQTIYHLLMLGNSELDVSQSAQTERRKDQVHMGWPQV